MSTSFSAMKIVLLSVLILPMTVVTVEAAALGEACPNGNGDCVGSNQECSANKCVCQFGYIENSPACRLPLYGEACESSVQCEGSLLCSGGTCGCSTAHFYDGAKCELRKSINKACSDTSQCKDTLTCNGNPTTCSCTDNQYWDGTQCKTKKSFDEGCSQNVLCKDTLICDVSTTKCICTATEYWDGAQCKPRVSNGGSCSQTSHCLDTLICNGGTCSCTSTQYWGGTQCVPKKSNGGSCTQAIHCLDTLVCYFNPSGTCGCSPSSYWDGTKCDARNSNGGSCSQNIHCLNTLNCVGGTCSCASTQYWDGGQCTTKKANLVACDGTQSDECSDANADCTVAKDGIKRCICMADYFQAGWDVCELLSKLQVSFIAASTVRTTDSISFTWTANKYGTTVSYRISYSPSDGTLGTINHVGGIVTGLTPGTEYTFTVLSLLDGNDYYETKAANLQIGPFWTKPAKPGPYDATSSQVKNNPMKFVFQRSDGNVYKYKVTLTLGTNIIVKSPSTPYVDDLNLRLGEIYTYEIIALNGNNEESAKTTGTFKTDSQASGAVDNLNVKDITTTSAVVEWDTPINPNGDIYSYVVQVFQDRACVTAYVLKCFDCENDTALNFPGCDKTITGNSFIKDQEMFEQSMTSLTVFTEYTVKVFAVTEAGNGNSEEKVFVTEDAVPENLVDLIVMSYRDKSNGNVGIKVTWTPGKKTGVTSYTVTVVDQVDSSKTLIQSIIGYDKNEIDFPNLLAFHGYEVSVVAVTRLGSSDPISDEIKTETTTPGKIKSLKIIPDGTLATKMNLEIECPVESERNGIISEFTVIKENSSGDKERYDIRGIDCTKITTVESSKLGSFKVNENYMFTVIAKNQDYSSEESDPQTFIVVPKPFIFEEGKPGVKADPNTASLKTSVTVTLCPFCITNPRQGEVTKAGLIVCVKSKTNTCSKSRRKRATATFDGYQTWSQANASQFASTYRTTPDGWIDDLNKAQPPSSFVIGDDNSCSSKSTTTYCNGPLPSGTEIFVTVIACTVAGCQESGGFVVKTKGEDDESDDIGLFVGVIVPVAIIIIAVIMIILFIRRRREKKTSSPRRDSSHSSTRQAVPIPVVLRELPLQDERVAKIKYFGDRVAILHNDSDLLFQKEFEDLKAESAGSQSTQQASLKSDDNNISDTQVRLASSATNESNSNAIDASYISGLTAKREYIVTQGPIHGKVPQFWKMVWEQASKVIVMLSDLTENNKTPIQPYWPQNMKSPLRYGDIIVEMINLSKFDEFIIRDFKISMNKMNRTVKQIFIPGWCGIGNNTSFEDVIKFVQFVRENIKTLNSGPPIIQCSAGVGRTGTFIALDYFMQYIEKHSLEDEIDVFSFVLEMRKCRPRMVQAETQYVFIFDVLVEVIQKRMIEENHVYDTLQEENEYVNRTEQEYNLDATTNNDADGFYVNEEFGKDTDYEIPNL